MENIDYFKVIALIGAIITFIVTYFNQEQKKYLKQINIYFDKLLVPFMCEYKENNEINAVKFINKNYKNEDYFIPPYIMKMVKDNDKESLKKVLLEDYRCNFPNNSNGIWRTMDRIFNVIDLIMVFIMVAMSFVSALLLISFILNILNLATSILSGAMGKSAFYIETFRNICGIGMMVPFIKFLRWLIKNTISTTEDEYTMNCKKINKLIKTKVKKYNKNLNKEYYG